MKRVPHSRAILTLLENSVGLQALLSQYWPVNLAEDQKKQWTQRNISFSTLFQGSERLLRVRSKSRASPLLCTLTLIPQSISRPPLFLNSRQNMIFQYGPPWNVLVALLITEWLSSWLGKLTLGSLNVTTKTHLWKQRFPRGSEQVYKGRRNSRSWTGSHRCKSLLTSLNLEKGV